MNVNVSIKRLPHSWKMRVERKGLYVILGEDILCDVGYKKYRGTLTRREGYVLTNLMLTNGYIDTDELLYNLYHVFLQNPEAETSQNMMTQHVSRIRKRLGPDIIRNWHSVGYRFNPEAQIFKQEVLLSV